MLDTRNHFVHHIYIIPGIHTYIKVRMHQSIRGACYAKKNVTLEACIVEGSGDVSQVSKEPTTPQHHGSWQCPAGSLAIVPSGAPSAVSLRRQLHDEASSDGRTGAPPGCPLAPDGPPSGVALAPPRRDALRGAERSLTPVLLLPGGTSLAQRVLHPGDASPPTARTGAPLIRRLAPNGTSPGGSSVAAIVGG